MASLAILPVQVFLPLTVFLSAPSLCGARQPVQILHESATRPLDQTSDEFAEDMAAFRGHPGGVAGWPVARLNEQIFMGNVLREESDRVERWFVYWCPDWWEPCQHLLRNYTAFAEEWQEELNSASLLTLPVRFGRVDCATDKVLCNTMFVEDYPTVQYYEAGAHVATWVGRVKDAPRGLSKFVYKHLYTVPTASESPGLASEVAAAVREAASEYLVPGDHAADLLMVLFLLLVNMWAVSNSPGLWQSAKDHGLPGHDLTQPGSAEEEEIFKLVEEIEAAATEPAAQEPERSRLQRMLPDEWRQERDTLEL
eukprot:TRINITY_DN107250_c0_g1_i1.p1 TRINITY_DN107250_c0_g1~~TRINITY_DN107250_c0_g1_i1.p1  ORF type:complete len:346 (+),score=63.43 TRINITY_DN107250_c0_g1_i1:107-1039(+)